MQWSRHSDQQASYIHCSAGQSKDGNSTQVQNLFKIKGQKWDETQNPSALFKKHYLSYQGLPVVLVLNNGMVFFYSQTSLYPNNHVCKWLNAMLDVTDSVNSTVFFQKYHIFM